MCKVHSTGITFRIPPNSNGLLCNCGADATFCAAWKIKRKPSYVVIPLCDRCAENVAQSLIDSGRVKPVGVS